MCLEGSLSMGVSVPGVGGIYMVGVHLPPPRVGAGLAPSPKPLQRGGSGRLPSHDPPLSPLPPLPPTPPHPLYQRCCPFKSAAGPPEGGVASRVT